MLLIVGLGNPGPQYKYTRHNLGFQVVDELSRLWQIPLRLHGGSARCGRGRFAGLEVALAQPQTFMNLSGRAVAKLLTSLSVDLTEMLVVHDDMDLPLGRLKFTVQGGAGGHRGISSIIAALGTDAFMRLKIGIGHPRRGELVETYVLSPWYPEEIEIFHQMLPRAVAAVETLLTQGLSRAMSIFHGPPPSPATSP